MKVIIFILLNQFLGATFKDDLFFDKIINSFKRNGYFISIKITSHNQTNIYVVENYKLCMYLNESMNIDKKTYKVLIKEKLTKNLPLELNIDTLIGYDFSIVKNLKQFDKFYKNKKLQLYKLINFSFKNNVLKRRISIDEKNFIISELFNAGIAVHVDDETGCLIISR